VAYFYSSLLIEGWCLSASETPVQSEEAEAREEVIPINPPCRSNAGHQQCKRHIKPSHERHGIYASLVSFKRCGSLT